MSDKLFTDDNEIRYKKVGMEQFDTYDSDYMIKNISIYDKRIGALLIAFSELEQTLDQAISFMIFDDSDDFGKRITMEMTYIQKIRLYDRFFKNYLVVTKKKDQLEKLKEISTLL